MRHGLVKLISMYSIGVVVVVVAAPQQHHRMAGPHFEVILKHRDLSSSLKLTQGEGETKRWPNFET